MHSILIFQKNPVLWNARNYLKGGGMLLVTEPTKHLAYCPVPKSGSSTWMMAFAEMNLIEGREARSPLGIRDTYMKLVSQEYSIYAGTYQHMNEVNDLSLFKFLFVRHPFDRLASCYQMIHTEKYFLKIIGNYQLNYMNFDAKDLVSIKGFMAFSTFAEFVIHEAENENASFDEISNYSPHAVHWWPYTELCGVCKIHYDLVAHMETFDEDLHKLIFRFPEIKDLKKIEKERFVKRINWHRYKGNRTEYHELFKEVEKIRIEKLYIRFKNDFEFGGYDYPNKFIDIGLD